MKTLPLLLIAGGTIAAGAVAATGPGPSAPDSSALVRRTGSGDGAGLPGAPGGRAGAPGRPGGWSGGWADGGDQAEPEGLRAYCVAVLGGSGSRSRAGTFRPGDCVGLFAAMARPDLPGYEDDVPNPGSALGRTCATLLKPGVLPQAGEPEACSAYVASLETSGRRREAAGAGSGAGSGGRAPDGPSIDGGIGGRGGPGGSGR
ncbi:hypothetical protein [Methylobacterium aquaticum]|uniref:Uncharacterized protein n=1 Tax=Methylobacterium aquaticum TaxID=270351 RepID=A0A0J6RU11_9HYPH|nr:hypothetical protein [Methylobacterium aquaticum]KMO24868.1 hypothetical protein VP06_33210 [Methylobacterium aquaticum]